MTESRGQKINANFFVQSFSTTLRVMDVRAENRGRPHQKVRFPVAPVVGRNFLTPGHSGVRVKNVRGKSGPKSLCLCCFSSLKSLSTCAINIGRIYERQRIFITKIHANLVFQACISFLRCFRTPGAPTRKLLVHTGMLPCLVPSWPRIMQMRISFRSHSDFVLDADHALDFLSYHPGRNYYKIIP